VQQSLSAADTDHHGRNLLCIDEGVEVFPASKIGEMNHVVRYLRDFAAHFFSRSQVELHNFPSVALKKTDDRGIRLQGGFLLSEHAATRGRRYNGYEKKRMLFHDCSFCGITRRFASK
jgi:hypothetical protein